MGLWKFIEKRWKSVYRKNGVKGVFKRKNGVFVCWIIYYVLIIC